MGDLIMAESIIDSVSFACLDSTSQAILRDVTTKYGPETNIASIMEPHIHDAFKNRHSLHQAAEYWHTTLDELNPAIFPFMPPSEKTMLRDELQQALYYFLAEYELHRREGRKRAAKDGLAEINRCYNLICQLQGSPGLELPTKKPDQPYTPPCLSYVGFFLGQEIAKLYKQGILSMKAYAETANIDEVLSDIVSNMSAFNVQIRLYWVWASNLLGNILDFLRPYFARVAQSINLLNIVGQPAGIISWALYFARLAINFTYVLKHTIRGPWMSKEELALTENTSLRERFNAQFQYHKYSIANDIAWGVVNLLTFAWLIGPSLLGQIGNVITGLLLLFDVTMAACQYTEKKSLYEKRLAKYDEAILILEEKKLALHERWLALHQRWNEETNQLKKARLYSTIRSMEIASQEILEARIKHVKKVRDHHVFEWKYEQYTRINELTYTLSLVVAFSILCCFYLPSAHFTASTSLIIGTVGAGVSFVLTVLYSTAETSIMMKKLQAQQRKATEEITSLTTQDQQTTDEHTKTGLQLEIDQHKSRLAEQEKSNRYAKIERIHAIVLKLVVPAVLLMSTLFLPLHIALPVIAAALLIAFLSYQVLLPRFKPMANPTLPPSAPNTSAGTGFFSNKLQLESTNHRSTNNGHIDTGQDDTPLPNKG